MEIEHDEIEGTTVWVGFDDDLAEVPETHRHLLTPEVRAVFTDVATFLENIRDRSPVPNMRKWFDRLIEDGVGSLVLEVGDPADIMKRAGFMLSADGMRGAIVGPPRPFAEGLYPRELAEFYRLVGFVDWARLMYAGKIECPCRKDSEPSTLGYFSYAGYHGLPVEPKKALLIGGNLCGDQMWCSRDGRHGGWWCHESGHVRVIGTAGELLDWVFGELLADRTPEYDHGWAA